MSGPIEKPRIAVLGLSLELYERALPGYMERWERQLVAFVAELEPFVTVTGCDLCYAKEQVAHRITEAERAEVDAIVLVPVSYTASGMVIGPLIRTSLPIVVWNTQETSAISESYSFEDLLLNHVTQGTQDLTNALLRNGRRFGLESGHYQDQEAIRRLVDWLRAAKAARFAQGMRVGLLGRPFQDMGDFAIDETRMAGQWGPKTIRLSLPRLGELAAKADAEAVSGSMVADRRDYEVGGSVSQETHLRSARLEWAIRMMVHENHLDALTFNFIDLIDDGRCETLPFFGINKLMGEGLGYAGEGDTVTAAHMAQMRQLCGAANFTEMFTVDYADNRMLMMHMQECNPALARHDSRIRLVEKAFWAPGIRPYAGMHFTLEPGPVTLTCISADATGGLYYVAFETAVPDRPLLENLDVPHWMVQLEEPIGDFLTRYSRAGGTHHLVSVPGHHADRLSKLAYLQGFDLRKV
jgi:L-arabinose isomerase